MNQTLYGVPYDDLFFAQDNAMMLECSGDRAELFVDMAITLTSKDKKLEINGHRLDVVEE